MNSKGNYIKNSGLMTVKNRHYSSFMAASWLNFVLLHSSSKLLSALLVYSVIVAKTQEIQLIL